jgi:hypothetical protein
VRKSRRLHLGLPAELEADLSHFARQHGFGLGPAIRLLVGQALAREGASQSAPGPPLDSAAALAALAAAEHAVLMVASVLPEGQRRMRELASDAVLAAETRLALVRESSL